MAKIKFDQRDDSEVAYSVLHVPFSQRKDVRAAAEELGDRNMVEFNKDASEWRLLQPHTKGVSAKKLEESFAKWQTPEMEAQTAQEKADLAAKRSSAEKSVPKAKAKEADAEQVEPARLYWPVANEKNERPEWKEALAKIEKETGVKPEIPYVAKHGAFVHKSGPTAGLESFQTPEAKAAWDAKGKTVSRSSKRDSNAVSSIDAAAFEAKGEKLMAASVNGLQMPSTRLPEQRAAYEALIKGAGDKELSAALAATEVASTRANKDYYKIQMTVNEKNEAKKKGSPLSADEKAALKTEFDGLSAEDRLKRVGRVMSAEGFARMASLNSGLKALDDEAQERGLTVSARRARSIKNGQERMTDEQARQPVGRSTPAPEPKQDAEQSAGRSKPQNQRQRSSLAAQLAQGASTGR